MLSNLYLYTQPCEGRKDVWIKREMGWLAVPAHQVAVLSLARWTAATHVTGRWRSSRMLAWILLVVLLEANKI